MNADIIYKSLKKALFIAKQNRNYSDCDRIRNKMNLLKKQHKLLTKGRQLCSNN